MKRQNQQPQCISSDIKQCSPLAETNAVHFALVFLMNLRDVWRIINFQQGFAITVIKMCCGSRIKTFPSLNVSFSHNNFSRPKWCTVHVLCALGFQFFLIKFEMVPFMHILTPNLVMLIDCAKWFHVIEAIVLAAGRQNSQNRRKTKYHRQDYLIRVEF